VAFGGLVSHVQGLVALAGATALVTGGAGFIGSRLCDLLCRAGANVHSASRRRTGSSRAYQHWPVDLCDAAVTRELINLLQPDYVFHLAGHVWATADLANVLPTFHSNLHSTVNLLHSLVGTDCRRFIATGSQIEPDTRSGETVANAPYDAAKWASSDYIRMFHARYQLPAAIARVFMVYGPQQDPAKLIPYVIGCLLRGETPKLTSGRRLGDWIYVDDVAAGLVRLALAPDAAGRTVDLGSGALISTTQLVEEVCALMESPVRPAFGAIPDRPPEPARLARIDETRRILDWAPEVTLTDGLRRTIDWCRRQADPSLAAAMQEASP
jgi:UDP-glucose 4-epimerase